MSRVAVLLCAILSFLPLRAFAHGDLHEQIQQLSARLRKQPKNAALVHKRGELHRAHGDYRAAFADYDRAEQLNPKLIVVHLSRGRTLFEAQRFEDARRSLTRFLQLEVEHAEAHLLRARVCAALRRHDEAEADFQAALSEVRDPLPDLFLERATNLDAAGQLTAALAVLDDGLRRLPGVITLQLAAIEYELRLERFDAALGRIESLITHAPRKEALLARKAAILEQAGQFSAARSARQAALAAVEQLPAAKRQLASTKTLEHALRHGLAARRPFDHE